MSFNDFYIPHGELPEPNKELEILAYAGAHALLALVGAGIGWFLLFANKTWEAWASFFLSFISLRLALRYEKEAKKHAKN